MVVTQTCDIVRACGTRPFVEVCPLVEIESAPIAEVAKGRRPRYATVDGIVDRKLAADLDRVMTVEKGVIAKWERTPGCRTDEERRSLAQALARKRQRFAFPDDLTLLVEPLRQRLIAKHGKEHEEGAALRALREIRVRAERSWDDSEIDLMFLFIRDSEADGVIGRPTTWDTHLERWLGLAPAGGRFRSIDGMVVTLDDITARDFVESDRLDLEHLSVS